MTSTAITARKVAEGIIFGEGIRWRGDRIILSDMLGERVLEVDPSNGKVSTLVERPERPNGTAVLEDGGLLFLSMYDQRVMHLDTQGRLDTYADLSSVATGYLGDMVRSVDGTLYVDDVGTKPFHGGGVAPVGQLIRVRPDKRVDVLHKDLGFPNGIVISPDGGRLLLAQSIPRSADEMIWDILEFDIDADGDLLNRRVFAHLTGPVDGMSMDEREGIWACVPREEKIYRLDQTGTVTHTVDLEGFEPISCSVGGSNGRTLCITAIDALKDKNIFVEMQNMRVRASVFLADVPYAKGAARP